MERGWHDSVSLAFLIILLCADVISTMSIPSAAIYMLGYEQLLSRISPYFTGTYDAATNASSLNRSSTAKTNITASLTPAPLLAGSLARTFSATAISPIEMFRTRLQALPSGTSCIPYIFRC